MRKLLVLAAALWAGSTYAVGPTAAWSLSGFEQPESVVYSSQQKILYVSNLVGSPFDRDGKGYISQVSIDGKFVKQKWFTKLNSPKGLGYYYGLLYVADIDELLEIDTGNGRVKRRFKAKDAKMLNDIAVASNGTVYVSDMVTNSIWVLRGDSFTPMFSEKPELENPNGLAIDKGQLIIASWGVMKPDFSTEVAGHLKTVDNGTIVPRFSTTALGNLDGLVVDGKGGYYVSDYMAGNIFHLNGEGEVQLWAPLEAGVADIGILPSKYLLVPNMNQNSLTAYPLDK